MKPGNAYMTKILVFINVIVLLGTYIPLCYQLFSSNTIFVSSLSRIGLASFAIYFLYALLVVLSATDIFTVIVYILYKEFDILRKTITSNVGNVNHMNQNLETYRLRHYQLCSYIAKTDGLISCKYSLNIYV